VQLARLLGTFTGAERFPCELVLCNLADTKRRTSHLGALAVDQNIALFDAIVSKLTIVGRGERSARVSGDQWLFLGSDGRSFARSALAEYALTQPYRAGWRCRATKAGEEKTVSEVVTTSIARTARFVLGAASSREDVDALAARLEDGIWQVEVATVVRLEDLAPPSRPRWECVASYPARGYYCPFCAGADFEWTDGDSAVYSGDADCKTCRATLAFTDAGGVLDPPPGP
jgi:hypothetical protein